MSMIPFSPPRIDEKIIDAVTETLRSGWITTGPKTAQFETMLTEYSGSKATLCVYSATVGLEAFLRWFGVGEEDEVIVPVYTYCATANVVIHCNAKPVFVDINKHDFNISVQEIEKAITSKTKVILPVDFGGYPCDYNEINELVSRPDIIEKFRPKTDIQKNLGRILVLEDAAHSLGAEYHGKKTGSLTDLAVFSFHAVKNLTTGEGGAIAFNLPEKFDNRKICEEFGIFSLHGQSRNAFQKIKDGNWRYDVVEAGYKTNMTDIMASIGLVELERYDTDMLEKRKYIFSRYTEAFSKFDWAEIPEYETENKKSSYHIYPLRIKGINEFQRDDIIKASFKEGVSLNVHFQPVAMFTYYKKLGYSIKDYPVAYDNYSREISLPVFYDLNDEQINTVIDTVRKNVEAII